MNVSALRDGGERRFLRFGDVVKIAGVVLEILDVGVDVFCAVTEFLASIDDRGNFEAADIADGAVLGQHGRSGTGSESDLCLLDVIAGNIRQGLAFVAADDGEFHLREALGDLVYRGLSLAADADDEFVAAGEIGQRLVHVGIVDVLDHLDLDLVAVLLLRGDEAVVTGFHPTFVGFGSGNQDANFERSRCAHRMRIGETEAEGNRNGCTGQYEASGKHGHRPSLGVNTSLQPRRSEQGLCHEPKPFKYKQIGAQPPSLNKYMLTSYAKTAVFEGI